MWVLYILFAISRVGSPTESPHDFHVSNTDIVYRTATSSLEITVHLFVDDVEIALDAYSDEPLYLCTDRERPEAVDLVEEYLRDKFQCLVESKTLEFTFLGKEQDDDLQSMWCYLEIEKVPLPHSLEIRNSLLTEVYDDQKNIVNIGIDSQKKQYLLFDDKTHIKTITL